MLSYVMRRFLQGLGFIAISTLVGYTVLVLWLPNSPGRSYDSLKSIDSPETQRRARLYEEYYEVDKPWPLNYLAWLFDSSETSEVNENFETVPKGLNLKIGDFHLRGSGVLTADFGRTIHQSQLGERTIALVGRGWVNTVVLMGVALPLALLLAVPLGIIGAARQGSKLDHALTFLSSMGLALPSFGLGILLIVALAVLPKWWHTQFGWGWLPYLPPGSPYATDQEGNLLNRLYHVVLPALTLAIPQVAVLSRYVRASMLDVMRQDYIRTAHAKGLPAWRVLGKHAFRNALIPLITVVGLTLPALASGAIIVEYLFAYQGMGQIMFQALGGCAPIEDRPCGGSGVNTTAALLMMLILVAVIAFSNMLADIMYAVADPRIEYGGKKSRA